MKFLLSSLFLSFFFTSIDAGDIFCDFYEHRSNDYTCNVTSMDTHYIDRVNGKHLPGMNNDDVKFLAIKSKNLQFLPRNLHRTFPNLEYIVVDSPEFKEILRSDLQNFGANLRSLSLLNTKIQELPVDLFDSNPNLGRLFVESKDLKSIDKRMFNKIPDLYFISVNFPCLEAEEVNNKQRIQNVIDNLDIKCHDSKFRPKYLNRKAIEEGILNSQRGAERPRQTRPPFTKEPVPSYPNFSNRNQGTNNRGQPTVYNQIQSNNVNYPPQNQWDRTTRTPNYRPQESTNPQPGRQAHSLNQPQEIARNHYSGSYHPQQYVQHSNYDQLNSKQQHRSNNVNGYAQRSELEMANRQLETCQRQQRIDEEKFRRLRDCHEKCNRDFY